MTIDPSPTVEELNALIVRVESIRAKWMKNEGYRRTLDIEIEALKAMRDDVAHNELIEKLKQ